MDQLQELQTLAGHTDRVWSIAWSADGALLASCSGDKSVRIWRQQAGPAPEGSEHGSSGASTSSSAPAWKCVAVLEDSHTRTIRCVCWAPNSRQLATASFDGTCSIWQAQGSSGWEQVATLEGHENEVKGVAWSPDGSFVATCGRDRTVWVWESLPDYEFEVSDVKQGHTQDVKMVAWHPRGELLASCSYDNSVKVWAMDGDDWVCAQTLEGPLVHQSTVWAVSFSHDGALMASCSDDQTVKVWAHSTQGGQPNFECAATLSGHHTRPIYTIDWSADDACLATGCGSNSIHIFTRKGAGGSGPTAGQGSAPAGSLPGGSSSPAAASTGSGTSAGAAHTTNGASGGGSSSGGWREAALARNAHQLDVNCVRWHPRDTGLLASAGDDGVVKLWRHVRRSP